MPRENQAELFIRVLEEEFEAYQTVKEFDFSRPVKAQIKRPGQSGRNDHMEMDSSEPLDCLHLMSTAPYLRIC